MTKEIKSVIKTTPSHKKKNNAKPGQEVSQVNSAKHLKMN